METINNDNNDLKLYSKQNNLNSEYVSKEDTVRRLKNIWIKVLQTDNIGIEDSFYKLGGHSLKAIALEVEINKEFNIEISLDDIYKNITISELAKHITGLEKGNWEGIKIAEKRKFYPLSRVQKGIFVQCESSDINFNIPVINIIEGKINKSRLEEVFKALISRHDSFRTTFEIINGEPFQIIHENTDFHIEYYESNESEYEGLINKFIRPFNLEIAPLLRVGLIKIKEEKYLLIIDQHHIVSDGTSVNILLNEISHLYNGNNLSPLNIQYKDYSVWQNNLLDTELLSKKQGYWFEKLSGEIPTINLPFDYVKNNESYTGDAVYWNIPAETIEKVEKLAEAKRTTPYAIFFAIYTILLNRYTSQEDIIIGSIAAGRNYSGLEGIIGAFVNLLPIRVEILDDMTFLELLDAVHHANVEAYENQDYTFDMIIENLPNLSSDRKYTTNPLFGVAFVLHSQFNSGLDLKIDGIEASVYGIRKYDSKMDIQIDMVKNTDGFINARFEYNINLFKEETIERMVKHYANILYEILEYPKIGIKDIQMISEEEKKQILVGFNSLKTDYSSYKPLHNVFENQVENTPNNVAVTYKEIEFTYTQLNIRSNQLARYLEKLGVESGDLVAIMLERSPTVLESILAIWKLGAAYIPIEPFFPIERTTEILDMSKVKVLLTQSQYTNEYLQKEFVGNIVKLDLSYEEIKKESDSNLEKVVDINSLAYIIYTSGSTGKPKGAMVEHLGMMNHLIEMVDKFNITSESVISQNASYCFDISVWQFVTALTVGGKTVIYPTELVINPLKFINEIIKDEVTILEVVPSYLSIMLDSLEENYKKLDKLDYLIVTGEAMNLKLAKRWFAIYRNISIANVYGPAEASDDVTIFIMDEMPDIDRMLIGKPFRNTNIYILDKSMNLCPIGVSGEICVSGISVGRGYLNDTDKTKQVFLEDKFADTQGIRLYKTGDLGRWLDDGNIEYIGRKDYQVKIRGFRIELGEIENVLYQHTQIKDVAVVDKGVEQDSRYLSAYFIGAEGVMISEIRNYLQKKLPEYMVPSQFIQLDKMPLTPNGKIDRKALKARKEDLELEVEYQEPENEIEEKLVAIWKELLNREKISTKDNFFMSGGNSLKAIALMSNIHKKMDVEISVGELFKKSTIKDIANYISNAKADKFTAIEVVDESEFYITSSAQKRIYAISKLEIDSVNYNIPLIMQIEGKLDIEKVEMAFNLLAQRHEALRTSFVLGENELLQKVSKDICIKVHCQSAKEEEIDHKIKDFIRPFDLSKAPLLRVGLIKLNEDNHLLLLDLHHIISDAKSNNILIKEFIDLYRGVELPILRIQYKDFAVWQNKLYKTDRIKKQESYWEEQLKDYVQNIDFPMDYERPQIHSFKGNSIYREFDSKLIIELNKLANETNTTLYMILFSAYNILLANYTYKEDIVVGTPVSGRTRQDLENIIGMFVNTLAIRSYPQKDKKYADYLNEMKQLLIEAFENQDYQFEKLIEKLNIRRVPNRNPIFDTVFTYFDVTDEEIHIDDLHIVKYPQKNNISKFDFTLYVVNGHKGMGLILEYSTDIYRQATIDNMAKHYIRILEAITNNRYIIIKDIEIEDIEYEPIDIGEIEFNFE